MKIIKIEKVGQGWQVQFLEDNEILSIRTWGYEEEAKRNVMEFLFPKEDKL